MNGADFVYLWLAMCFAAMAAAFSFAGVMVAPKHCQYLVPIKTHPGIYGCSEYPHGESK